jgi:hypothetical protein
MGPGQPWQVLPALPAWQVTQLPRPFSHHDGNPDGRLADDGTAQRAQELVSAYCRAAPVAVAWVREQASGPVRVITAGPAAQAVEMFAGLLAEIRAYGEGLVIAEQIPAKLIPDVIKNTAVKIVHRLPAADDWDQQLTDALGAFRDLRWPRTYLRSTPPETGEAAS